MINSNDRYVQIPLFDIELISIEKVFLINNFSDWNPDLKTIVDE